MRANAEPIVYAVQEEPKYDLTPALKWGKVVTLLPPGNLNFSGNHLYRLIDKKLTEITAEDYLLLIGSPVAIAVTSVVAAKRLGGKPLMLLKWHNRKLDYLPVKVEMR
jgi:hypothetical protein